MPEPVFTKEFLYHYCHPTTAQQSIRYEYLKHSHCHRCPESVDCDVEDFLSCEVAKHTNFNKCNCFLCIENDYLREILQCYFREIKKKYKADEVQKERAKKKARERLFRQEFLDQPETTF